MSVHQAHEEITRIMTAIEAGDAAGSAELLPAVYEDLRKLAAARMKQERPGQTLQATALVHEAYLRITGPDTPSWDSRNHFFKAASEAMRRILIEKARRKMRIKHGERAKQISLDDVSVASETGNATLLSINEALDKFAEIDPVGAELVKLRFFVGLPNAEAANVLGLSPRSADRSWAYARSWLYEELREKT